MPINSNPRSLVYDEAAACVRIIDQTLLPGELALHELNSLADFCEAITSMRVRGAPLIGITAAYGLAVALRDDPSPSTLAYAAAQLAATRPTAVNLSWALARVTGALAGRDPAEWCALALAEATAIADEEIDACRRIGEHGLALLDPQAGNGPLNILTHCNAGRLATLEWGTALAPVYLAHSRGMPVHVWVSETRPRNQGAALTAWELEQAGIPYTVIVDSATGPLMQAGRVDCCIVGSDRVAANGDVCNKVGTYLKAVLADRHRLPFYAAMPVSTIDWDCENGALIPIEERAETEVLGSSQSVDGARAWNPAFDVTPAALVTRIITERGVVDASREGLCALKTDKKNR
jgi:methylthioribose-1-phosphate isomerase